jgi:hypothetical protein
MRLTTKTLEKIEDRMRNIEEGSIRHQVLQNAKNFKTSWIELGQSLHSVWKDKLYKEWGYVGFDAYAAKEIGIRKQTALKLLKSYYFLEKEEPSYLRKDYTDASPASKIPTYESVNVLRQAKNKKGVDEKDYTRLRKEVFEQGKDDRDIKKDLTALIRESRESEPQAARENRRKAAVKRLLGTLKALKAELGASRMVPASILKETSDLISKIESQVL